MSLPLPTNAQPVTWKTLEQSRNLAATNLLAAGLLSQSSAVRHRCLKALVARNEENGFRKILCHWEQLEDSDISFLRKHSEKLCDAARGYLADGSLNEKKLALQAISELDLTDSADILLEFVLDDRHPLQASAIDCLLSLCRRLGRNSRLRKGRTDEVRQTLMKKLHGHLLTHSKVISLMDAWLAVVHWDDAAQRGLLQDPGQAAYSSMISRLSSTNDRCALQLLAGYFWRPATPEGLQEVIVEKSDPALAVEMTWLVPDDVLGTVLDLLRKSRPLKCFTNIDIPSLRLAPDIQRRLLLMVAASRDDLAWTLETCMDLSRRGRMSYRHLAADLLSNCKRPELEEFVRQLQNDSLLPTESQQLTSTVQQVLQWLDSPSIVLRKAACHLFAEFTVERLAEKAALWPAPLCRTMATIVSRTDKNSIQPIESMLVSPSPKKRLIGLRIVEWLHCGNQFKKHLLTLVNDSSLEVRVRAIDTLSSMNDQVIEEMIPRLLQDTNSDVVEAAERAFRRLERQKRISSPQ